MYKIRVERERCKACGYCLHFCPRKVFEFSPEFNHKGYHPVVPVREENCTGCGICYTVCPDVAITIYELKEKDVSLA